MKGVLAVSLTIHQFNFPSRIGTHFWQADQSQIYPTLSKMEEDGWLTHQLEVQSERPNRKVYHLTDAVRAELTRWLHTEQPLPINRDPFLIYCQRA